MPKIEPSLNQGSGKEFLETIPSNNFDLVLTADELRFAIGLRLNCEIVLSYQCKHCETSVDSWVGTASIVAFVVAAFHGTPNAMTLFYAP
ncbi:unnamed protein product [Gordionus sp. m RMFG-2023]